MSRRHKRLFPGPRGPAVRASATPGRGLRRPVLLALGSALGLCLIGGLTALLLSGGKSPSRELLPARAAKQPATAVTNHLEASIIEWVNRGNQLMAQGKPADAEALLTEAQAEFEAVLRIQPDFEAAKAALAHLESSKTNPPPAAP